MKTPFINARWKGKEEGGDGRVSRKKKKKKTRPNAFLPFYAFR